MKCKEFFTDESKWHKSSMFHFDKNNEVCSACLYGAIIKCYGTNTDKDVMPTPISIDICEKVVRHLLLIKPDETYSNRVIYGRPLALWNDADERSFEDIRRVVEELDI